MQKETTHHAPLLDPERIAFKKRIESKKCAFDILTELLITGQKEITKNQVFDALIAREKLGNTCIGNGIAVPKTHLAITNPRAAVLILKKGLKLGAADKQAVTLFLAIIIPDKQHKKYNLMLNTLNQELIYNGIPDNITDSKNPNLLANFLEKLLFNENSIHGTTLKNDLVENQ